ncbi:MAG: DUF5112 domain-containing protein [Phocaeicola vulgatus]
MHVPSFSIASAIYYYYLQQEQQSLEAINEIKVDEGAGERHGTNCSIIIT